MQKSINSHLAIGGCITKETIAVIPMAIPKGSLKGMIMDGTKPKNIIKKYSKRCLEKLSSNGSTRAGQMMYQQRCGYGNTGRILPSFPENHPRLRPSHEGPRRLFR